MNKKDLSVRDKQKKGKEEVLLNICEGIGIGFVATSVATSKKDNYNFLDIVCKLLFVYKEGNPRMKAQITDMIFKDYRASMRRKNRRSA